MNTDPSQRSPASSPAAAPLDYAPADTQASKSILARAIVTALLVLAFIIAAISIWRTQARPGLDLRCMGNLRQLYMAARAYAENNRGVFPDSLDTLIASGYVGPNVAAMGQALVCPVCDDDPATAATLPQLVQAINSKPRPESYLPSAPRPSGHVSYIYAGRGMTLRTLRRQTVVFYEPYSNGHMINNAPAICAVFEDGHCEIIPKSKADPIIAAIRSRIAPLPPPASAGASP